MVSFGNTLLDLLSSSALAQLNPYLTVVDLKSGDILYPGASEIDWEFAYFPIDAVGSMLTTMTNGSAIEGGTVGREGLIGTQTAFGSSRSLERWIAQVPGSAVRIGVADFRRCYIESAELRAVLTRYLQSYLSLLSQTVACNGLHKLSERCARWLLMTHDRCGRDQFMLTHEFLALMLGVQRPAVSIAAASLQELRCISYSRGKVTIVDRTALEAASCECYEVIVREDRRLLAEPLVF